MEKILTVDKLQEHFNSLAKEKEQYKLKEKKVWGFQGLAGRDDRGMPPNLTSETDQAGLGPEQEVHGGETFPALLSGARFGFPDQFSQFARFDHLFNPAHRFGGEILH